MADEDQERFEDYLELESYIEALQVGKVAHPPTNLTLEQARIYQMAVLFHSATNEDAEPRPDFVENLKAQLLEAGEQPQISQIESATSPKPLPHEISEPVTKTKGTAQPVRFVSRRHLLAGGAIAAASMVVGAGIGTSINHQTQPQVVTPPPNDAGAAGQRLQMTEGIPTRWQFVTTLADLGDKAIRFTSDAIVGYVVRAKNTTSANSVIALSAACTHKGCLVQWKTSERHFVCPCHGAIFDVQGTQKLTNYAYTLLPLPSLNTKIEDDKVYVEIPL
ncbi:hypothetical protein KDA_72070 [Dictyobacter alpinus]|uniref:Rieske domain-containing protein n=1 Tax=Dictyobacter alpinus TaxID=2014873 RepID=A0A402BK48_9CHLR|nr:Rieske (2Fe-2S) protein [Dictyobacter alpinus]GCE31723.1 hypothetical protein KDA_72070 [Dictyobacter alpinus]